jgi:hypothetical protein
MNKVQELVCPDIIIVDLQIQHQTLLANTQVLIGTLKNQPDILFGSKKSHLVW